MLGRQVDITETRAELGRQLAKLWPLIALIYAPVLIAFAIVMIVRIQTGIAIADFTADPLIAAGGFPVYTGIIATITGLVWAATAGVLFFAWGILRDHATPRVDPGFLLAAAIITFMLMVDDVFLGHEIVYPRYLRIPENVVYAVYGLAVLWFLYRYRSTILRTDYLLLVLALVGFGLSILTDIVYELDLLPIPGVFVLEDGAKSIGVASWAGYLIRTSAQAVSSATRKR
jgi:hypothetical protein